MRATGTGEIPLHIEMINTANPPDFVSFIGVRADPARGGYSLVSHFPHAISQLTEGELEQLQQPVLREGLFYDLTQVACKQLVELSKEALLLSLYQSLEIRQ